jgi:hypothetical protein
MDVDVRNGGGYLVFYRKIVEGREGEAENHPSFQFSVCKVVPGRAVCDLIFPFLLGFMSIVPTVDQLDLDNFTRRRVYDHLTE